MHILARTLQLPQPGILMAYQKLRIMRVGSNGILFIVMNGQRTNELIEPKRKISSEEEKVKVSRRNFFKSLGGLAIASGLSHSPIPWIS